MNRARGFCRRVFGLFGQDRRDAELSAELESHLALHIEENLRAGLTPEEARRQALIKLGGLDQTKEAYRDRRSLPWLDSLLQDVRFALRMLRKSPGFTIVAILTLALGIGANTTIFSFANVVLLHPIALPDIDRLAIGAVGVKANLAAADYFDWMAQSKSFESMSGFTQNDADLSVGTSVQHVIRSKVSANFFDTLKTPPMLGRGFLRGEDDPGRDREVILSYGLWQSTFSADPNAIGKIVALDSKPFTVVGVMGSGFDFPVPSDVWIPFAMTAEEREDRAHLSIAPIGRLKPEVSLAQAQSELAAIAARLQRDYPQTNKGRTMHAMSVGEYIEGSLTRSYALILMAAVGIVLLIACSNIANLQIARISAREREMAIRAALGSSRWRRIRLLLVENVLLALLGAAASTLISMWVLRLGRTGMPAEIARLLPTWNQLALNWMALSYTFLIALIAGLIGGSVPAAVGSRTDLASALKEGGRGSSRGRSHYFVRQALIAVQIAVAFVLLIGSGLMVKGFHALTGSEQTYAPQGMLTFEVSLPPARYADASARARFYRQALDRLSTMPGVDSASIFDTFPLSNNGTSYTAMEVEGKPGTSYDVIQHISPNFLRTIHVPILSGREFSDKDRDGAAPVAIVSEKLARNHWPNGDVLGKQIRIGTPTAKGQWLTVVGIASDVLYDWTDRTPEETIYVPYAQQPRQTLLMSVRSSIDSDHLAKDVQAEVAAVDPEIPIFEVMTLKDAIHESLIGLAFIATIMSGLGVIALVIALVGIYGVMSYAVAERTHEIGVRMSLGAQRSSVLWMVSRQGLLITAAGLAAGFPLSIALAKLFASIVFGASAVDAATFIYIPVLLGAVAICAAIIPARRATQVDPMIALRHE